jgi:CheY-like chemotaxis protein
MLSNLVGNAIKFTRHGHVHIESQELARTGETSMLEFAVSDTGIGVPADKIDLLFKPFSQADSSTAREFSGSGLGLSIVINLAKAMGGDVGVNSEPGNGSRFWFRIPVSRVTDIHHSRQAGWLPKDARASDNPEATLLIGHVLVAEDNLVNRMVIESLLEKLGLQITMVNDGQEAVDSIISNKAAFALVLMDLHMPVLDGYGATKQIRKWEFDNTNKRLPIIALTADAFEEDRQHCLAVGMDDFLTKPVDLDTLKSTLIKWLPDAHQVQAKSN